MAGIGSWKIWAENNGIWDISSHAVITTTLIVLRLFMIIRLYLVGLPALVILKDLKKEFWDDLRISSINDGEIIKALFISSILIGVIPLTIVCSIETDFLRWIGYHEPASLAPATHLSVIVAFYLLFGLTACAIGFAGSFIWRHPAGIISAILAPVLFTLLFNTSDRISYYIGVRVNLPDSRLLQDLLSFILAPDHRINFMVTVSCSIYGHFQHDLIFPWLIFFAAMTLTFWVALWYLVRHRLRHG
ncbi:hypothetical protein KAU08_10915 [bacterium]|nr:hypothetical protein [bacterium]